MGMVSVKLWRWVLVCVVVAGVAGVEGMAGSVGSNCSWSERVKLS